MKIWTSLLFLLLCAFGFAQEEYYEIDACCEPMKRWYIEVKPGYYYFTDSSMREFFNKGGFTIRGETGYRFWKPFTVWLDAGYFEKKGHALGRDDHTKIMLGTFTIGLKTIFDLADWLSFYAGAGPRLFLLKMHNETPFIRSIDNEINFGGGFQGGFWLYPIPCYRPFFLDLFVDYSWKKMRIHECELSSANFDLDVSGISAGVGLGIKF